MSKEMTFDDRIADWNTICDQRDSVPNLIGQDRVKSQLNFHFKGYLANGICLLLCLLRREDVVRL